MITDSQFDTLAQYNHFLFGFALVITPAFLFGGRVMFMGVTATIAWCAWKEFWYDYRDENAEVRGSSLKDFSFYMLGVITALLVSLWRLKHA